jgi:hypothetical protein
MHGAIDVRDSDLQHDDALPRALRVRRLDVSAPWV